MCLHEHGQASWPKKWKNITDSVSSALNATEGRAICPENKYLECFSNYQALSAIHLSVSIRHSYVYRRSAPSCACLLYLDATGTVVQKVPDCDHNILYYALHTSVRSTTTTTVPVTEMLSSDQNTSTIHHLLALPVISIMDSGPIYNHKK